MYVDWLLQLREQPKRRRSVDELCAAAAQPPVPRWAAQLVEAIWMHYTTQQSLVRQPKAAVPHHPAVEAMTRSQRRVVRGHPEVRRVRSRLPLRVQRAMQLMQEEVADRLAVCWLDNFSKFRYSRNPNVDRSRCIHATVYALLPTPLLVPNWVGWKDVDALAASVPAVAADLLRASATLAQFVRLMLQSPYTWEELRVPVDIRRHDATPGRWFPADLQPHPVGSTPGLVAALQHLRFQVSPQTTVLPMLVDINVFYRVAKACYALSHAHLLLPVALHFHPMLFACWHCYAHCVQRVHTLFLAVWAPLQYADLLSGTASALQTLVYGFPKLITLEHMVLGLYLLRNLPGAMGCIEATRQWLGRHHAEDYQRRAVDALRLLLDEYVPALVHLGILARDLYWRHTQPHTGHHAREFMLRCLVVLRALEPREGTEYVRGLSCALLLWSDELHGALPGRAFMEEALEASLSRLSQAAASDLHADTADQFRSLYQCLGPPTLPPRLDTAGLAEVFPFRLRIRLQRLCDVLQARHLPCVTPPAGRAKFASVSTVWPPRVPHVPSRLVVPLSGEADYRHTVCVALRRLLEPKSVDDADVFRPLQTDAVRDAEGAKGDEVRHVTEDILRHLQRRAARPPMVRRRVSRSAPPPPAGPLRPIGHRQSTACRIPLTPPMWRPGSPGRRMGGARIPPTRGPTQLMCGFLGPVFLSRLPLRHRSWWSPVRRSWRRTRPPTTPRC